MAKPRKRTLIQNSTDWSVTFIRRMLSWVSKEVGLDRPLLRATFRKRNTNIYSGRGGNGRIVVGIRKSGPWPTKWDGYVRACKTADGEYLTIADAIECLVILTAHETAHVWHFRRGIRGRGCEEVADTRARYVLRLFREKREELLAKWSEELATKPAADKPSLQERRAAKVMAMLLAWERKLKIAKTKVASYKRRAKYYERAMSASRKNT